MDIISTTLAPRPAGAYGQAVVASGFVFTAGMAPVDPQTGEVIGTGIGEQTRHTLDNLQAVLQAAGSDLDRIVKVTVHLEDVERDWAEFDSVFGERFGTHRPARTTVGSRLGDILVEIDAIALAP
ncbi:Rid family detoxifying hydrolase [Mycolicibacterium brisbanense]|uniref:Probable endoribonuclease L-PSP n=1 Tax=Mycolicibacterium brisbanense TaxID=146020 RepID=A0A100W6V6_9MYCO|nr:Rid family detoxifying hydrolase [Mycolicibacterium brisbanense]MCV7162133.1 RidA family protein [Mycolicibacterium brisbanense]GAS92812.1 probable endoribonuclease L-PSP [Mycolicibacterium brisbanense]